jgi:glutamate---cysteine ligase / carboxylate-amine ligase
MLDLAGAWETFAASTDLTVGIEEEFALLDPATYELVPEFERLRDAGLKDDVLAGSIAGELISSEIEIRSGRGEDLADALNRQVEARRRLFRLADAHGVTLGATGTHPLSDYQTQHLIDTEHYRRVGEGLKYVAWRNNTFSVHVHVGVRDGDRAVRVCDRLRPVLPTLLAISANSPFVDRIDSGLHTARTQIFTKSFPRCGVPDAFGSWRAWAEYVDLLQRTGSIVEFTQLWWSVRPHHAYGTVEVRICDAQMTARESDALVTLIAGCVAAALRDEDDGRPVRDVPGRLIEENVWRAIRHGMDGALLDLDLPPERIAPIPAAEAAERLAAWAGVSADLPELNGAQRQRRLLDAGATPGEVYAECVKETTATYQEAVQK